VLFGSDFPLLRQGACLRKARAAGLDADDLELVLGGNAARLLSRPADPPLGG
jgi:predicted TIM-barrel fold metal-dependent hydrolase